MSDEQILKAAYNLLTERGNELAVEDKWEYIIDRAHHYLALLIMRLNLAQNLAGSPGLIPKGE
jgi:hypothetical protein